MEVKKNIFWNVADHKNEIMDNSLMLQKGKS